MADKKPFDWVNASDDEREVEALLKMQLIGNELVTLTYAFSVMIEKEQQLNPKLMDLISDFPFNLNEYSRYLGRFSVELKKQQEQKENEIREL